jgi:hypothetical protein
MEFGIRVIVRGKKRDYLSSAMSACGRVESRFEIAGDAEGRSFPSESCHCILVLSIGHEERRDRDMETRTMTLL